MRAERTTFPVGGAPAATTVLERPNAVRIGSSIEANMRPVGLQPTVQEIITQGFQLSHSLRFKAPVKQWFCNETCGRISDSSAHADPRWLFQAPVIGIVREMAQTETIVGSEGGLRAVLERARVVASSDLPVLIYGETGTGKEVVARTIHERSPRCGGPFRRVNCAALAPELIDSELFGHERGAFTGSIAQRRGWFEQAHGGTLFLDEVGDLSLAAQVRLLRVLQDGELLRVGGETPVRVDVRIIAATHRDLAAMVASRTFREDLYYRLAVFPIVIPPLRDRTGDIPGLVRYFAERAIARFGLRPVAATAADLALLSTYPWPGNVRELCAVIDRAVLLGDGKGLDVASAIGPGPTAIARPAPGPDPQSGSFESLVDAALPPGTIEPLAVVMRRHIERALVAAHGRVDGPFGAARLLALNPHTLRARMRKLKVDWRGFRDASAPH